ncbi:cupredoxin domain-containing protein [Aromatoleum diolicum]|uniref:Blue (type 1) copper domain-containing protein n=1 Tax=Aromatoleum diolicum TaxID=75796 RepID=A0ABX1QD05_9RHOO|nr:plastocyanin/azurin family copper-binding protein [Aromatoleum diolicum]NMG75885.1 hypothetical protein [Aromatoleum diolicum]
MTDSRHCAASIWRALTLAALVCFAPAAFAADEDSDGIHLHPALVGIDWSAAIEVEIALQDHHYEPEQISLKRGQPYRLVLKNVGAVAHDMVGGSLLNESVIALRMVNSAAGRVLADYVNSVYVRSKNSIELWLVPLKEGEYSFYCSLPGHRDDGMEGVVHIMP